jgi:peptidoglycan biosynthesis protein MviN/MurJ (putative lipid II flippase)
MKRYAWELGASLALYGLVLTASLLALRGDAIAHEGLRLAISLAPMVPCGLTCWALLRQMRRLDELGLRIQFEAVGFAFAATAMLTFGYGFLENVGFPRLSLFVVWPLMASCWGAGLALSTWRYR